MVQARAGRLREAVQGEVPPSALFDGLSRAAVLEVLADMARVLGADAFIAQSRAIQRRLDHQKTLRRFLVPALIIGGAADPIVPPRRQDFTAELMPKGRFLRIANSGSPTPGAFRRWKVPMPRPSQLTPFWTSR